MSAPIVSRFALARANSIFNASLISKHVVPSSCASSVTPSVLAPSTATASPATFGTVANGHLWVRQNAANFGTSVGAGLTESATSVVVNGHAFRRMNARVWKGL